MKKHFFGGVHPAGQKHFTASAIPERISSPSQVVIPLRQHIGAACTPLVSVGDHVLVGQKIGDGEGLCVPVHASVSGTVVAIEPRPHISGTPIEAIVIESDGLNTRGSALVPRETMDDLDRETLLTIIREAGIVGMGGATFPTGTKASMPLGQIDTVIVNACECEPYITADDILMQRWPDQILKGLSVIVKICQPKRVFFAVEDNKPKATEAVRACLGDFPGVELVVLPTRYPQGSEKHLIAALTGREVPSGKLPKDVACVVFNAATYLAIYRAVFRGQPLTHRLLSVTGEGIREPKNLIVPLGTPLQVIVDICGGLKDEAVKVITGGPMMGAAQRDLNGTVVKGTNGITCLTKIPPVSEHPTCIRCGKCVESCPMGLQPLYFHRAEAAGDYQRLSKLRILDCLECGCCAYACPAKIPLVERIRAGKKVIREGK